MNNSNFRLPRKIKKKLKKTLWLYPADEKGNSLKASPRRSQKDYDALKQGIVRDIMAGSTKATRKKEKEMLAKPIEVSDDELKVMVADVFDKEYRTPSFLLLKKAKGKSRTVVAYYNFINAYNLVQQGHDSYDNVCCMAIDYARDLLKRKG